MANQSTWTASTDTHIYGQEWYGGGDILRAQYSTTDHTRNNIGALVT